MSDFLPWSHSRRKTYKSCPKMLYHTAVLKKNHPDYAPYIGSKAQQAGTDIDDALTNRISKGVALAPQYAPYEPMCQVVLAAPGTKLTQVKLAFDQSFKLCGYTDWDRAWLRVIYDLAVINGEHAYLVDWKNGQIWLDEDQLALFAVTAFYAYPEVQVADTSYAWLSHGLTSDKKYHRRDAPDIWATLLPDVERMQASFKANHWPATPSNRACGYCQVNAAGKCPVAAVAFKGGK